MSRRIRIAISDDIPGMMEVKRALPMPDGIATTEGGFLLGTTAEEYRRFIEEAHVLVLEDDTTGVIDGFAVVFGDSLLRKTEVWQKRELVSWDREITEKQLAQSLGYFEQLAVLPQEGSRFYATLLAYHGIETAFKQADLLFTTIVRKPVLNLAAVPLLKKVNAERLGSIDETYPVVGQIVSDLWMLSKDNFELAKRESGLVRRMVSRAGELKL